MVEDAALVLPVARSSNMTISPFIINYIATKYCSLKRQRYTLIIFILLKNFLIAFPFFFFLFALLAFCQLHGLFKYCILSVALSDPCHFFLETSKSHCFLLHSCHDSNKKLVFSPFHCQLNTHPLPPPPLAIIIARLSFSLFLSAHSLGQLSLSSFSALF